MGRMERHDKNNEQVLTRSKPALTFALHPVRAKQAFVHFHEAEQGAGFFASCKDALAQAEANSAGYPTS